MNFLAHCSLAHDAATTWQCSQEQRQGLLAGAVIGDFVKGRIPQHWPEPLRAGTCLHRKVDALSNISPGIRQNCDRYPRDLRRFAPIFVDMLADHCLALSWTHYYDQACDEFTTDVYAAIDTYNAYLSTDAKKFFDYIHEVDLLANYDQWSHVARGLKSVLRRLRREHLWPAVEDHSLQIITASREDFAAYYPALRGQWSNWNAFKAIAAPQNS